MEGRGSLRQLHQQVSGFNSFDTNEAASDWQSIKQRPPPPPPPPPPLPPWSASFAVEADDGAGSGFDSFSSGWNKPKPMRGLPPKRLVTAIIPPLQRPPQQVDEQLEERAEVDADNTMRPAFPSVHRSQRVLAPVVSILALQQQQDDTRQENQRVEPELVDARQQQQQQQQQQEQQELRHGSFDSLRTSQSRPVAERAPHKEDKGDDGENATSDALQDTSNQLEDSPECENGSAAPPTGFFRPWKKASSDDAQNDDGQVNKWKVRALINPFAKRKPAVKAGAPTPKPAAEERGVNVSRSQPDRIDSPAVRKEQRDQVVPRRPPTPSLSDPSLPAQHHPLRPRVLRSREGLYDNSSRDDQPLQPQDNSLEQDPSSWEPKAAPPRSQRCPSARFLQKDDSFSTSDDGNNNSTNADHDNDCSERDTEAVRVPDWRAKPAPKLAKSDSGCIDYTDAVRASEWRARPAPKVINQSAQAKKNKGSTMDALAEIKRKRDERRQQQAEEKQRIKSELEEHGDDSGYKFRRLIQKYREGLPPAQLASVAAKSQPGRLPSLSKDSPEPHISSTKLFVFIRKRPLSKKELKAKGYDILTCLYSPLNGSRQLDKRLRRELLCHEPKLKVDCSESLENHQFQFDGVFDEAQANEQVYEATVGPMIPYLISKANFVVNFTQSYQPNNLTIFAYGQTGSGKTYTMKSMYRQAATAIFTRLDELCTCVSKAPHVSIGVSFYEIYMNTVNDLLNGRSRVQIMEDGDGTVQLPGLKELPIESADELLALVKRGEESRATSANAVHDDSSRSHALLRVTLYAAAGQQQVVMARLSMVDLAGSERACDTQSDSKNTRMEGAEINKSLLALKECIRALDRGATHIPFRQSKLTQLLRDSFLSENSKTIMIATVSPWSESCNHTLNTLRYADRLKEIGGG